MANSVEVLVNLITADKNDCAKEHLEKILKDKCTTRVNDVLKAAK